MDEVLRAQDNKEITCGIFFDISKAFDSLDPSILLSKLMNYGFRGQIYVWLSSYLSNRQQFIVINGASSGLLTNSYGVPQGSVLGPLLFLVYINDLGSIPELNACPKLFADDTNIFVRSKNLGDLKIKGQNAINKISDWMFANNLTLNSEKSYYMIFFPTNQDNHGLSLDLDLNVNNIRINRVQSSKFLGVTIDDQLKWSFHIQELCLTLRRFVGIFYKLSCKLPSLTLKILYFAIIYPRILYGIEEIGRAHV